MAVTASASPASTASTLPSRRLRTQPSSPRLSASRSTKARKPTPCTRPRSTLWRITCVLMPAHHSRKLHDHRVHRQAVARLGVDLFHRAVDLGDRKSTRLNSSHLGISY